MPVHDLGYRAWVGGRMPRLLRPWVVARSGVSLVWRRRWLRMMIMMAWLPIIVPALGIFAFEYSSNEPELSRAGLQLLGRLDQSELAARIAANPDEARHDVWATLILAFFRYPQAIAMVLLVGIIAPMMISYDLRSKAYLMYFSRPLTPPEYIVGKSAVIWFFLAMISTVPALGLYVLGVLLSPDLSVIGETWDIPFRIILATIVLVVPTTVLALCYSAFTSESRYATFAWFATWAMGGVAYRILTFAGQPPRFLLPDGSRPRGRRGRWAENADWQEWLANIDYDKWRLLSPYHILGKVEGWVFGLDSTGASVMPSIIALVTITIVGLWLIRSRIVARLRT